MKRFRVSGGSPHLGQGCATRGRIAVLHPAIELLRGKAAKIRRKVRLAAYQFTELNEFIGPELIGIVFVVRRRIRRLDALPKVCAARTLVGRADAIAPIVTIRKAAPGKADDRGIDLAHLFDQFLADAVHVGNAGVLAHPDAVINDSSQILGKVPIDVRGDRSQRFVQQDFNPAIARWRSARGEGRILRDQQCTGRQKAISEKCSTLNHASPRLPC